MTGSDDLTILVSMPVEQVEKKDSDQTSNCDECGEKVIVSKEKAEVSETGELELRRREEKVDFHVCVHCIDTVRERRGGSSE